MGKTTFVTVLLHELDNRVGPEMGFILDPLTDEIRERYEREYHELTYGGSQFGIGEELGGESFRQSHSATPSIETNRGVLQPLVYPLTTEAPTGAQSYDEIMRAFYDTASDDIAAQLDAGRTVAVICEGDAMLYGSYMYLHDRLAARYATEVVPGVCAMLGGAAMLGAPLVYRDQSLTVLSGTLPGEELARRLRDADAAVVMKLGRNLPKVRAVLDQLGLSARALYIERATMPGQRIVPLAEVEPGSSPYFSILLVPGPRWLA